MAKSSAHLPSPAALPKRTKTSRGATAAEETPLSIRSAVRLEPELRAELRERLGSKLSRYAREIERVSLRMLDVNGPRGGVDTRCQIKVVISGRPSVIVEELATDPREAFRLALPRLESAVRRELGRAGRNVRKGPARRGKTGANRERDDDGSLIGRRVGRGPENLLRALERPEKQRRDAFVDTSAPDTSASDRKAGYGATAARNTRARAPKAIAALEDSRDSRPSRKSTRRSANRQKAATPMERQHQLAIHAPGERAARAKAKPRRGK